MKTYHILHVNRHNPSYKMVEVQIYRNSVFLDLIYAVKNNRDEESEHLEVYYKKIKDGNFYKSRRFVQDKIPTIYKKYFDYLRQFEIDGEVPNGYKIIVEMPA